MQLFLSIAFVISSYLTDPPAEKAADAHRFQAGEQLDFKLSYGWFTVGKAAIMVDASQHKYAQRDCFRVDINGSTAGLLGVFTRVDDKWGAYVKADDLKPLHAWRDILEGNYMRKEFTYFNHDSGKVEVLKYDPRKEGNRVPRHFEIENGVNDLVSAYLRVRNLDFTKYKKGDMIILNTFYEDTTYRVNIRYGGLEDVKSKVGTLKAHKVNILLPENDIFPEEEGIVGYISADMNHLPLRVEVEMFFGRAYCDLVAYRNIKYGVDYP